MDSDLSDMLLGSIILVVLLPLLYLLARGVARLGDASTARRLAPLAPFIEGSLERTHIRGRYKGHQVRVSFSPGQSGESATRINAFLIEVLDLAGQQDWRIQFHVSGWLGQGPNELRIHVPDQALGERLHQAGVLAAVAQVSAPTQCYVTVEYRAQRQKLTYTDDVSPGMIPSFQHYAAQLALIAYLVTVNGEANPVVSTTR
jgi:hypothetical protein